MILHTAPLNSCGIRITCPVGASSATWHSTYSCHVHIKCDARHYYLRRGWFRFGSNSPDFPQMIYMIQMSMFFAGIATLIQTIGFGQSVWAASGARDKLCLCPIMVPLVAGKGVDAMAIIMGGVIVGVFSMPTWPVYWPHPICPTAACDRVNCVDDWVGLIKSAFNMRRGVPQSANLNMVACKTGQWLV